MRAQYSNADNSAVRVTLEAGETLGNQTGPKEFTVGWVPGNKERDALQALVAAGSVSIAPYVSPPVTARVTYKADIWRRCTDAQAEALDALLRQRSVREQRMYDDAQQLAHSDPDFLTLRAAVVDLLGQSEADRILAPSV